MKMVVLAASLALLGGCASTEELTLAYDAQVAVAESQSTVVTAPTLTIKCSTGCDGLDVAYIDPRDRSNLVVPKVSNTNDVIIQTLPSAMSAIKWLGGFWAGTQIVDSVMDNTSGNIMTNSNTIGNDGNINADRSSTTVGDIEANLNEVDEEINNE